jgi:hypothetical protein
MAALQGGMIETRGKDCQLAGKCSTKRLVCRDDLNFCASDLAYRRVLGPKQKGTGAV